MLLPTFRFRLRSLPGGEGGGAWRRAAGRSWLLCAFAGDSESHHRDSGDTGRLRANLTLGGGGGGARGWTGSFLLSTFRCRLRAWPGSGGDPQRRACGCTARESNVEFTSLAPTSSQAWRRWRRGGLLYGEFASLCSGCCGAAKAVSSRWKLREVGMREQPANRQLPATSRPSRRRRRRGRGHQRRGRLEGVTVLGPCLTRVE